MDYGKDRENFRAIESAYFIVNKKVNKIEIKKAVEEKYGVNVESVNTIIMPAKAKSRNTRSGIRSQAKLQKAIVT